MDNLLKLQLDTMANTLRFTKNAWWKAYHLSREVIDLGTTFTKFRADILDSNNNPIKNVVVSLLQNGVVIYTKKTDAAGVVSIVKIKPGNYDIRYEKSGFITQTEGDYHFAPGSEKIHHIHLGPTGGPANPPGFTISEIHLPAGGSMLIPLDPGTPGTDIVYLLCLNGTCKLCTTDIPAVPCAGGFQLNLGVPYQGPLAGLGIDLTKSNFQFQNLGAEDITIRIGTPI
jgi:hypothetical protein